MAVLRQANGTHGLFLVSFLGISILAGSLPDAATRLSASYRGRAGRRKSVQMAQERQATMKAATTINAHAKGHVQRKRQDRLVSLRKEAATRIGAVARGYSHRQKKKNNRCFSW